MCNQPIALKGGQKEHWSSRHRIKIQCQQHNAAQHDASAEKLRAAADGGTCGGHQCSEKGAKDCRLIESGGRKGEKPVRIHLPHVPTPPIQKSPAEAN